MLQQQRGVRWRSGVRYRAYIYPGAQHGFNNDTTLRYDAASAKLAWRSTVDFFNKICGRKW
ncbi:MAG: dienelactone hydrolase family protein [Spongiibacteraceae bacterium]